MYSFADKSLAEQRALEEYINESASYLGEKEEGLLHTLQGGGKVWRGSFKCRQI